MKTYEYLAIWYDDISEGDIRGGAYKQLIATCFKYSSNFALIPTDYTGKDLPEFRPYALHNKKTFEWPGTRCGTEVVSEITGEVIFQPSSHLRCNFAVYPCCDETKQLLYSFPSLFYRMNDKIPIDISFFREDKSLLFASVSHEGLAFLFIEKEDFDDFRNLAKWDECELPPWYKRIWF
jgi:hypothetical protein